MISRNIRTFATKILNNDVKKFISNEDKSVNWITEFKNGNIETRYVRKKPEYFIGYVSSHSGCKMGCKQCFLTQDNQTTFDHVDVDTYVYQIKTVLEHYDNVVKSGQDDEALRMNINFMARGEPLANKYVVNNYVELYDRMNEECQKHSLYCKPNISTIMPYTVRDRDLVDIFQDRPAFVYYSLYSINERFRKIWMPNAIDWKLALEKLKNYQEACGQIITFHWAFIENNNDNLSEAKELAKILKSYNFNAKFNVVRFNPHPNLTEKEPSYEQLQELFNIINDGLGNHEKSYIVPRVGFDVKASCGMFVKDTKK
jgi:adenine C2-methylase RlmN of 23S rRNA A2503 and tRNA A37